jgi:signal transduction histidine kinase
MPDGQDLSGDGLPHDCRGAAAVGRVCILRDITQLKEIDTLKSDFVSTVSHDLRSPLTLMRGYASMLEMAGELNEQQKNYVDDRAGRGQHGEARQQPARPGTHRLRRRPAGGEHPRPGYRRTRDGLPADAGHPEKDLAGRGDPRDLPHAIEADQALLHQALYNLVENALKYTAEGAS